MHRGYKVKLYPTKAQATLLDKHFGCARWVYNMMIEINQKKYHRTGKGLSKYDMQAYLPKLKKQYPWLKEVSSVSLQAVCHNLADAYGKFYRKQAGFPNFKKRNGRGSFTNIGGSFLFDKHIQLLKLGKVKYRGGDRPDGKIRKFITSQRAGKYYTSVLIDTPEHEPDPHEPHNILGIDLGLHDFIVTSAGVKIKPPKYLRMYQARLKRAQQTLSRRKKGSNRKARARLAVAVLHEKIANKRKDFHHKTTRTLIANTENQSFAIEDLNIKGMMANHALAKSIADSGWYQFLMFLKYKAAAVGKPVLEVSRWFPSSKACSACGIVNNSLTLSMRKWTCKGCDTTHDRDINAALNIALETARNAVRGDGVIPTVVRCTA